jgi:hypothetical protein
MKYSQIEQMAEAEKPRKIRQYYFRMSDCRAKEAHDPDCICWHDEGTGPLLHSEADRLELKWRDKPCPDCQPQPDQEFEVIVINQILGNSRRVLTLKEIKAYNLCAYQCALKASKDGGSHTEGMWTVKPFKLIEADPQLAESFDFIAKEERWVARGNKYYDKHDNAVADLEDHNVSIDRLVATHNHEIESIKQESAPLGEEYTEGICSDGSAILCDGIMLTISEVLRRLNEYSRWNEKYGSEIAEKDKAIAELVAFIAQAGYWEELDEQQADNLVAKYEVTK